MKFILQDMGYNTEALLANGLSAFSYRSYCTSELISNFNFVKYCSFASVKNCSLKGNVFNTYFTFPITDN